MGLGARLFKFRRHQDPRVANDSKLKFDRTVVLYAKYVVDTNESQTLPCICVSYYFLSDGGSPTRRSTRRYNPMPEVGSEVILVDEAGETPGTPWSFSCITSTTFSFAVPDAIRAQLCTCVAFLRRNNNKPISDAHLCKLIEINRLLANSVK